MRKTWAFILIAMFLFPLTVGAKGGPSGFSSGGRGAVSSPRASTPSTSTFKSGVQRTPGTTPRQAQEAYRAQERSTRATTYVHQTTVVQGGGGGSWFLPAMLGYYMGGGCNRDRQNQNP